MPTSYTLNDYNFFMLPIGVIINGKTTKAVSPFIVFLFFINLYVQLYYILTPILPLILSVCHFYSIFSLWNNKCTMKYSYLCENKGIKIYTC